jgi:hypothetical protein
MHKLRLSFTLLAALTFFAGPASAGTVDLGHQNRGDIKIACFAHNDGKLTSGSGPGGYGGKTSKGEVSCDKDGHCTGNCGNASAPGNRGIKGILSASGRVPAHTLTPQ